MKHKRVSNTGNSYNISFSKKDSAVLHRFNLAPGDFVPAKIVKKISSSYYLVNIHGKNVFAASDSYEFNEGQNIFTEVKSIKEKLVLKFLPQDTVNRNKYLNEQIEQHLNDINYPITNVNVSICKALLLNNVGLSLNNLNTVLKYYHIFDDNDAEQIITLLVKLLSDDEKNLIELNLNQFENKTFIYNYYYLNNILKIKIIFLLNNMGKFLAEINFNEDDNLDINIYCINNYTENIIKENYEKIIEIIKETGFSVGKLNIVIIKTDNNCMDNNKKLYTHIDLKI